MPHAEKTSRLNLRITAQRHKALKDAAALSGTSVTEFVLVPAVERAQALVAAEQTTRVQLEVARDFMRWLDEPGRLVPAMKSLADAQPFDVA